MKKKTVQTLLADKQTVYTDKIGTAFAPVNFALIKYWGKRDIALNIPITSSLSVSIPQFGAETSISYAKTPSFSLNNTEIDQNDPIFTRFFDFLALFPHPADMTYAVKSLSTIPVGAGLASSASGFAAAVKALDRLNEWKLSTTALSILARLGSGSASRSLFDGFSQWHAGTQADGMDSYAEALPYTLPDLRMGLVIVSSQKKKIGSTEGMKSTAETSILYRSWAEKVRIDLANMHLALQSQDLDTVGKIAESNALGMHATMIDTWPPVLYWQPETVRNIHKIHALREKGLSVYFTMDAGPNLKVLFHTAHTTAVQKAFPNLHMCL